MDHAQTLWHSPPDVDPAQSPSCTFDATMNIRIGMVKMTSMIMQMILTGIRPPFSSKVLEPSASS